MEDNNEPTFPNVKIKVRKLLSTIVGTYLMNIKIINVTINIFRKIYSIKWLSTDLKKKMITLKVYLFIKKIILS